VVVAPVMLALRRLKQEGLKFKCYIARPVSEKQRQFKAVSTL
jgi:hypothetical protein